MTALPAQAFFKNEIGPMGAECVHKIPTAAGGSDSARDICPPRAYLVLKARVVVVVVVAR